jgi:hypothetical protein
MAVSTTRDRSTLLVLGYALSAGVGWWVVHLCVAAALVSNACDHGGSNWSINVVTVVTALGCLSAVLASLRVHRLAQDDGRLAALAIVSLLFNVIALAVTVLEGMPALFLGPCA